VEDHAPASSGPLEEARRLQRHQHDQRQPCRPSKRSTVTTETTISSLIIQLDVGVIYQITDNVFFRIAPQIGFSNGGTGTVKFKNAPSSYQDQSGGGSAFTFEITSALAFTTNLHPHDLADISDARLQSLVRSGPVYLLVRPSSLAGQWRRRPPCIRMARLARSPGLIPLASRDGYTLFRPRLPCTSDWS